jgi:acyl homoserine lactone synthase
VIGVARLPPTSDPHLLSSVFPQLLDGLPPPNSNDIWELSRFAAVDFSRRAARSGGGPRRLCSAAATQFFCGTIAIASERGAARLISVSPLGVERWVRYIGLPAHRAGPPINIGGHPIFACCIELENKRPWLDSLTGPPPYPVEDYRNAIV